MAIPSQTFQLTKAFFHTFGKFDTEASQLVYESKFKAGHNVLAKDIWADTVPYAFDQAAADSNSTAFPAIIKKHDSVPMTEVSGSNGQAFYMLVGGEYIANWISPVDVLNVAEPSHGYRAILMREDTTRIPETAGVYLFDYHSGIVAFEKGSTPFDLGYGTPKVTCYAYVGNAVASAEPLFKGLYANLADLQAVSGKNGEYALVGTPSAMYYWNGSAWVETGPRNDTGAFTAEVVVNTSSAAAVKVATVPAGYTILSAAVSVDEAWNGVGAGILVGVASNHSALFGVGDTDLTAVCEFTCEFDYVGPCDVYAYVTPGTGATMGIVSIRAEITSKV